MSWALCKCSLMNDHEVNGMVNSPQEGICRPGPSLSLCLVRCLFVRAERRGPGSHPVMRGLRRQPWAHRQEVAVVSRGSSSLQHVTDFTECGCSSRKALTTEPQRLVIFSWVTWKLHAKELVTQRQFEQGCLVGKPSVQVRLLLYSNTFSCI